MKDATPCSNPHDTAPRLLYGRKEAARQLSLSLRALAYLLSQGKIHTRKIGSRRLIPHSELVRFAKGHHPQPIARNKHSK